MSGEPYVIGYRTLPAVERAARRTMADHIDREEAAWKPFLDFFAGEHGEMRIPARREAMSGRQMTTAFDQLRAALDDPAGFRVITADSFRRTAVAPPPSGSTEGQLMLGLHASGRTEDAAAAFARFVAMELAVDQYAQRSNGDMAAFLQRGEAMLAAGHAAAALPASKLSAAGIRASKTRALESLASLDGQVAEAAGINAEHAAGLSDMRASIAAGIVRVRGALLRAERGRGRRHREWRTAVEAEVHRRFDEAEARLDALDRIGRSQQQSREKSFEELKALFHTQLRLRAPVALWEKRSETHHARALMAQRLFWATA